MPEVAVGLPGEEAADVPALLLRVGPGAAGDPRSGVRLAHHPVAPAVHLRQHGQRRVQRPRVRQDPGHRLLGRYPKLDAKDRSQDLTLNRETRLKAD